MSVRQDHASAAAVLDEPVGASLSSQPALTRVLNVDISTNLADICLNADAGRWAPSPEALSHIFKPTQYTDLQGNTTVSGELSSCAVSKVELLHLSHNFPCAVGIDMPIVPAQCYNSHGEASTLIAAPHAKIEGQMMLHNTDSAAVFEFARQYPGYTLNNVRSKGVHLVASKGFALIDQEHPIISAIQSNKELLQLDATSLTPADDGLVRISTDLLNHVLPHVEEQIKAQVKTDDLSSLAVSIKPGAARAWNDVRINALACVRAEVGANRRQALSKGGNVEEINSHFDTMLSEAEIKLDHTPRHLNASLKITYHFLDQETSAC